MLKRLRLHPIESIMSRFLNANSTNANSLLENVAKHTFVAEQKPQEADGVPITLPLSLGPLIQNQTKLETVSIQRYEALQNEYASITKRYRLMYDAFSEMRIEIDILKKERDEVWKKKK